jgi:hypothetical protein
MMDGITGLYLFLPILLILESGNPAPKPFRQANLWNVKGHCFGRVITGFDPEATL